MARPYNFAPGPATLPLEVLQEAAAEMTDWHGSGMSVMEMSHRGEEFMSIHAAALADARELLSVPDNYKLIFLQGGGLGENAIVPMNLAGGKSEQATVDFILTGSWTRKSAKEAEKYCKANIAATAEASKFTTIPPRADWKLTPDAAYVHICSNETIDGIEYHFAPDVGNVPLVADMSSHIMARPVDVTRYGAIFGGAQKNLGPAGLTMVIVREDLLDQSLSICPSAFNWKNIAENNSMYNTPPTYAIYIAGLVFTWLKKQGGVKVMEQRNIAKAALLYDYLDSTGFYQNRVDREHRSRMNVPFYLQDETLNAAFLAGAKEHGLLQLKGHKSVGGMRASLYNAMPLEGVQALVAYMKEFEAAH